MTIRKKFEEYYKKASYQCLEEKNLIDRNSPNVQFIISSFDNLVPILEQGLSDFSFYTVQRTFRTKNSHVALWGKDSFLLPLNVMMSTFSHTDDPEKVLYESLNFLIEQAHLDPVDLYCVFSDPDTALVNKTYGKYLEKENYICVPEATLKWSAPLGRELLSGRYIKVYKRHYTGFILVMDCNIFTYQEKKVVDLTFPQLTLEAATDNLNTVYETVLLRDIVNQASEDPTINDPMLFSCLFISSTAAMSDGALPNATKEGSSLRKLMRICYFTVDAPKIDLLLYINFWAAVCDKYNFHPTVSPKVLVQLWTSEFSRIEKNNRYADKILNQFLSQVVRGELTFDNVIKNVLNLEATYGIDHRYSIKKLRATEYAHVEDIESAFTLSHSTCAIPMDYSLKNTNKEFLRSLFMERV